jgi:hypothetical protein
MNEINKEPQRILFHYTSMQGLIGIFSEKAIWATSIYHLNDQKELFFAVGMYRDAIENLKKGKISPEEQARAIYRGGDEPSPKVRFFEALSSLLRALDIDKFLGFRVYVCSFSRAEDHLSQWWGYCPNANGFCIGFNYLQLKQLAKRQRFKLKKCIYERDQQQRIVNKYVKHRLEPALNELSKNNIREMAGGAFIKILQTLPLLKDDSFKEEKEWRLVSDTDTVNPKEVEFRGGKTTIVPYYKFKISPKGEPLPIESIIIGPTPYKGESLKAISALLEKENMLGKVKVIHSKIPYRQI